MPWQQLDSLRRVYFARRTAPTLDQYKTPTQPERGSVPAGNTYPHIHQGAACVPAIMAPTNSCDAKYCGVLVIITQMCKCLQDKNLPVWLLEAMTEQSTGQHTVVLLFCPTGTCDVPLQDAPRLIPPLSCVHITNRHHR